MITQKHIDRVCKRFKQGLLRTGAQQCGEIQTRIVDNNIHIDLWKKDHRTVVLYIRRNVNARDELDFEVDILAPVSTGDSISATINAATDFLNGAHPLNTLVGSLRAKITNAESVLREADESLCDLEEAMG